MTSTRGIESEFSAALKALGWSKAELARRLGIHPNSVSKWASPPQYAMAYLRQSLGIKDLADRLVRRGK
ncbi:MAG: helix-turn-helix domain-containing protein [Pseudomonadota bacterium]